MIGRTNASYGKMDNPFIAKSDAQMAKYLGKSYLDCFVRMEYDKYKVTAPLSLDYSNCKFVDTIGSSRMLEYVKKWLGEDNQKCVLVLKGKTVAGHGGSADGYYDLSVWASRAKNPDGQYGYVLAGQLATHTVDGVDNYYQGTFGFFAHNVQEDVIYLTLDDPSYSNKIELQLDSSSIGTYVSYSNIAEWNNTMLPFIAGVHSEGGAAPCTWTSIYDDALVLTNSLGEEAANNYIENGVYKVIAHYNEINTYAAESPFQVGDQLAGATVYLNQQITSDEFEAMCDELAKGTDFGFFENMFIFANVDYPLVEPEDDNAMAAFYTPFALLFVQQYTYSSGPSSQEQTCWQLGSYSVGTDNSEMPVILGKKSTANGLVPVSPATPASFTVLSSITIPDLGALTVPATIAKINFPTLLNAIAGKTANFSKQTVLETSYSFEFQVAGGNIEEVSSPSKLTAKAIDSNIGKVYQYTGADKSTYKKESLYMIVED